MSFLKLTDLYVCFIGGNNQITVKTYMDGKYDINTHLKNLVIIIVFVKSQLLENSVIENISIFTLIMIMIITLITLYIDNYPSQNQVYLI